MVSNFTDAISAYRAAARSIQGPSDKTEAAPESGQSFASLVKNTIQDTVSAGKKAEQLEIRAITGKADLRDVVTAVSNAQLTLETVVALRDKVVNAYNEVLKMPL